MVKKHYRTEYWMKATHQQQLHVPLWPNDFGHLTQIMIGKNSKKNFGEYVRTSVLQSEVLFDETETAFYMCFDELKTYSEFPCPMRVALCEWKVTLFYASWHTNTSRTYSSPMVHIDILIEFKSNFIFNNFAYKWKHIEAEPIWNVFFK